MAKWWGKEAEGTGVAEGKRAGRGAVEIETTLPAGGRAAVTGVQTLSTWQPVMSGKSCP